MKKRAAVLSATLLCLCSAASAQDYPQNTAATPGIPANQAVNPALDARGQAYLGVGEQKFYDPMDRERAIQQKLDAAASAGVLSPRKVRHVQAALARVVAEDRTQIARHGTLRDWDRERLNDMMNKLVETYPNLRS